MGWVISYVRNILNGLRIEKQNVEKYDTVHLELTAKKIKITIAIIYRPSELQAADDTGLYNEMKSVIRNKQAVIIGNINCPNIDWAKMNGDQKNNRMVVD